ncbi:gadd-34 apoptosis-associated-like protein [Glossina pallidipes salivary gland hypertrophy virus]|uniref:Protein DP71L n=2 Tax=Glossina hytrovirus (isolate Glossina pallidipes/Ethiopia/Seibersdorf/-) TaxID=379529 RepID=B0YLU8_GHVS|nr:hypothetical protein SGHV144 [Glossina pallidipes salivary gland hypertrophy virus]ABQ08917.1 hypothetical protein SGHV144 [Glossina pallidipes salivary gland hypertrophy virus]AMB48764.1 gadd-34 apoptosis-associated-like protein [Glossina pallidipes salivary gland hypertrophy virus]
MDIESESNLDKVMWDDSDDSDDDDDYYYEDDDEDDDYDDDDEDFIQFKAENNKKVRFDPAPPIVHKIIAWDFAYRAARKGEWEIIVRDRARFKTRITRTENKIKHILDPEYRNKIYTERFLNKI